jgi:hypothetical protein
MSEPPADCGQIFIIFKVLKVGEASVESSMQPRQGASMFPIRLSLQATL